jgi:hypothetical protein
MGKDPLPGSILNGSRLLAWQPVRRCPQNQSGPIFVNNLFACEKRKNPYLCIPLFWPNTILTEQNMRNHLIFSGL